MNSASKQPAYSFGTHRRLLSSKDYQSVFDNVDSKLGSKYFTYLFASSTLPQPRLGLVISKRNVPLAAKRNLIKRIARESFRLAFPESENAKAGFDVIVLAKPASKFLDPAGLNQELSRQWNKYKKKLPQ